MPTTPAKNLLYRAALPILAPRSRGQMTHHVFGHPLTSMPNYERILAKHHVFGASLLLQDGANCALCDTSTAKPEPSGAGEHALPRRIDHEDGDGTRDAPLY